VQRSVFVEWVYGFYERQGLLTGLYSGDPDDFNRGQAARIRRLAPDAATVLELAAGGGQAAAAAADDGLAVTAVELVARAAANARRLAVTRPGLRVLEADMYSADLHGARFDAVVYWDGIGSDQDRLVLLRRIRDWMAPGGRLLLDVYTPWYWAVAAGRESSHGTARSRYGFDPYGCRMLDRWWDSEAGGESDAVEQSPALLFAGRPRSACRSRRVDRDIRRAARRRGLPDRQLRARCAPAPSDELHRRHHRPRQRLVAHVGAATGGNAAGRERRCPPALRTAAAAGGPLRVPVGDRAGFGSGSFGKE
jgi:SAM-dependent methyltransferase